MNQEQEEAFVKSFIVPDKQARYLQLLANTKRRDKVLKEFYHSLDTVPAYTIPIAGRDHFPAVVEKILRQKGAGSMCYLISPEHDLDQKEFPLQTALDILINQDGVAVVCCLPGRLAYYKAELTGSILERAAR